MKNSKNKFIDIIASGLYTGYFPIASGTVASVLAMGIYYLISPLNNLSVFLLGYILTLSGGTLIGIITATEAEKMYGEKDSHKIVIDEIVGYMFAMFLVPTTLVNMIAVFFIFRIFDVIKPGPIRKMEKLEGGMGVMLDDILSGICTCIVMHIALFIIK